MIKFPSISQFREVVKNVTHKARFVGLDDEGKAVYNPVAVLPKLMFRGTVKLHGTNSAIRLNLKDNSITYQSRERELSLTSDNAGFMLYMKNIEPTLRKMLERIYERMDSYTQVRLRTLTVFGEWCGGSIQKGVSLNQLEKMFVIFGVRCGYTTEEGDDDFHWFNLEQVKDIEYPEHKIYNILNFPTYELLIDFENPHQAQNILITLTEAVEAECPVGKFFGVSGVGEGIVWSPIDPYWNNSGFWFKVKGEKHQNSKVTTLASVDVESINSLNEFVASVVTENRLEQGLDNLVREQLKPFAITSMGDFLRWVYADIMKEELDVIVANQFDPKKLGGPIANVAKKWFINKLNEDAGL